jgi:hypothetical protein
MIAIQRHTLPSQRPRPPDEPTAVDVVSLLRASATELKTSRSRGSTPFVFPVAHVLTDSARRNAEERLAAAWLYLRHRRPASERSTEEVEVLLDVGYELAELLGDSEAEADRQFLSEVLADLEELSRQPRAGHTHHHRNVTHTARKP